MAPIRKVIIVHRGSRRALASLDPSQSSGPAGEAGGGIQPLNHYAIEVGEPGNITRFDLAVAKDGKTVSPRMVRDNAPGRYRPAMHWADVEGQTSLTDQEIEKIAKKLAEEHGTYQFLINNCHNWSVLLFNEIANVHQPWTIGYNAGVSRLTRFIANAFQ